MSGMPERGRLRKSLAAAAVAALAAAGVVATAPAVQAAPTPRTYTASLTPTSVTPGVQADYALTVKNTSSSLSALDRIRVTIPAGFTVVPGPAPRSGWTQSVSGSTLTVKTSYPLTSGLLRTQSFVVTFKATAPPGCTGGPVSWPLAVDGVFLVFVGQTSTPTVTVAPVADSVVVTSVLDRQTPPLDHQAVVDQPFDVSVAFLCGGAPAPAPATTLSLSSPASGTLTANPVAVPAGALSSTIAASYSEVQADVPLDLSATGGLTDPPTFAVDIVADAATADLSPGENTVLTVDGASAALGNGASGVVTLIVTPCVVSEGSPCPEGGSETSLTGNFKNGITPLYGFGVAPQPLAPAKVTQTCGVADCPHGGGSSEATASATTATGTLPYDYNYYCQWNTCGYDYNSRELEEDFDDYKVYVSILDDGEYQPYAEAPRCVPLPTKYMTKSQRTAALGLKGVITNPAAQQLGFCVDVNAITRTGNSFGGDLNLPVLFVEDPKFIVGR